ncbi:MAG TPA: hypothetical protein VHM48_11775, partial [Candidatus Limnocylindrales bacterium]|nr:hypothetical protein [Candidatus Limnocylindrales bacterium]
MTSGRVSGGPSRDAEAPTRTTWTRDGIGAIVAVLALGLVFRLFIVQVNPLSGFGVDVGSFRAWAGNLAANGVGGFYDRPGFLDYTPGYLYVLWAVGVVGQAVGNIGDLIKIPPILSDIALGWLVWSMVRELGGGRRAGLIGAALVVANPVSWFDSVLWGQVDSFGVVFLLLGVREVWRDRPERAAVFTVVAALIKPQLAILAPVLAVVTIRRAFWPTDSAPVADGADGPDGFPARPGLAGALDRFWAWERRTDRPIRIMTTGLAGFLTAVVLCFPFGLSVIEPGQNGEVLHSGLIEQVFKTAGGYPYASVNAYNPWALASIDGAGVAADGQWACDTIIRNPPAGHTSCPEAVMIGPFTAVVVGAALLAAAFLIVSLLVARRPTPLVILTGVTILAIAFFILPTRVHERYLFPFIAIGAILAAVSVRWRIAYVVLSVTTFLNMYVVLTTLYPDNPGIDDWLGIGGTLRSTTAVQLIALTALAAALWAFAQLRPTAQRALDGELIAGGDDDGVDAEGWVDEPDWPAHDHPSVPAGWRSQRSGAGAGSTVIASAIPPHGVDPGPADGVPRQATFPTWTEPGSFAELGPIGWFRARLGQRPVRADRSHALHDEPPGRLDRLDLWILVVLVVSVLGIRMFRLGEPYQMHFDEVYHARTAAEFLQSWRYGIDHDIYEWTHPHLAKYAMAGGLIAWGDDRVNATSDLGVPVVDAAIERRTDDTEVAGRRDGDRVDLVTGAELRSYDLVSRDLVATQPIDGAVAVAVDPSASQLFIGSSAGTIWTFDASALDGLRSGGSPGLLPEPVEFGQVDGSIKRLFVPDDGSAVIVVTADDQVRSLDSVSGEVLGTVQLHAVADVGPGGTAPTLVGTPGSVADPHAVATRLATLLGGSAATYEVRLSGTAERLIIAGITDSAHQKTIQGAIDDGRLAGLSIDSLPQVAVADANGLELINPASGSLTSTIDVGGAAHGLALATVDRA